MSRTRPARPSSDSSQPPTSIGVVPYQSLTWWEVGTTTMRLRPEM